MALVFFFFFVFFKKQKMSKIIFSLKLKKVLIF